MGWFAAPPQCPHCGGDLAKGTKYPNELLAVTLFIIGVILCVTLIALPIGLLLILIAAILDRKRVKYWQCRNCHHQLARF
jgi:Na+/citrate or Na+/malate symporter